MKAIQAEYEEASGKTAIKKGAGTEDWPTICQKFNDDVERICNVDHIKGYSGLYACYDDAGKAVFYLVEEDDALRRIKRRNFYSNIGMAPEKEPKDE